MREISNYPNNTHDEHKTSNNYDDGIAGDVATGKNIADLNSIFQRAEDADRELFAEMRSNILLVAGEHYTKKNNRFWNRLRDSRMLNSEKKLRITKNHIQRITKIYKNNILKFSPGVKIVPQLDTELQDVKAAEMNQSVWKYIKEHAKYKKAVAQWAGDFIEIGECATKIYFDPNKGALKGYEPLIDPFTGETVMENQEMEMLADNLGNPIVGEDGQPVQRPIPGTGTPALDKNKPVFSGKLCMERILPFNLLRDPDAKSMEDSPYLVVRKMTGYNKLLREVKDPEIRTAIEKSKDETFLVFDGANGKYEQSANQVLLREYYFKPCAEYPRGYYYVTTKDVIIWEGELPGGVFPICWEGFDEIQTTPRKKSIIKQLRHNQIEINRAASQAATHQITLGDDKLVVNSAAKVTSGGVLPGVRVIKTNSIGANGGIHVLPGRAGEQFIDYISREISDMYEIANLKEEMKRKQDGNMDIWGSLYGSIKNKKEFSIYTDSFEDFLTQICETSLRLARYHFPDDEVIEMVGRKEQVNMAEFRRSQDLGYQIEIEAGSDDAESLMGKQQLINHTLQYVGKELGKENIGRVLAAAPIGNLSDVFSDLTIDHDNAKNDVLQLERGEMPMLNKYEDMPYKIKAVTHRMKQSDYNYLDPGIQNLFAQFLQQCEQIEAEKTAAMQRAQSGFIPTDGYMVKADFYVTSEDGKTKRATVPYSSMEWLLRKLDEQGARQDVLMSVDNTGALADMSQMVTQMGGNTLPVT